MLRLVDQPSLGFPCGTSSFSCMRGGGILERCHENLLLKPLYLLHFLDFFGFNVRLNSITFSVSFHKAFVKDFGLKVYILYQDSHRI